MHRTTPAVNLVYERPPQERPINTYGLGITVAQVPGMVDEQGEEKRGAQQETSAEREAKKNPANQQDLEKPSEGRDEAPANSVKKGTRGRESPWMGGG